MSTYFRPEKLNQYIKSLLCFLLAFTLALFTGQYLLQGIGETNQLYLFALIVFAYYWISLLAVQLAQQHVWSNIKTLFTPEEALQFKPQTEQMLQRWHTDILQYLKEQFSIAQPLILIYDIAQRRYRPLFTDAAASLPANHALVYVAKQQQHFVIDDTIVSELPEVTALDIQWVLKQYKTNRVIPIGVERGTVCGFIFCQAEQLAQGDAEKVAKRFGAVLSQIIQHDSVTRSAGSLLPGKPAPKISWPVGVTLISFVVLTTYWLAYYPYLEALLSSKFILIFSNIYGVVAIWGGVWGLRIARQWRKSPNIYRALLLLSIGLLLQEFGQIAYSTYWLVLDVTIPYPSIGDIGFFGSVVCYFIAVIFLAKAAGLTFRLKSVHTKVLAVLIPVMLLVVYFFLFVQNIDFDLSRPVKLFLDLGNPIIEAVYVSIAILTYLLTRDSGGKLRSQVFAILLALIWYFFCDFIFFYQASVGTWEPNNFNDYMYLVSYVLMTLAVLRFRKVDPKK